MRLKQPSKNRGRKRELRPDKDSTSHFPTKRNGARFTITGVITVTFVTTIGEPFPTTTTKTPASIPSTSDSVISTSTPLPIDSSISSSITSSSTSTSWLGQPSPFEMMTTPMPSSTLSAAASGRSTSLPPSAIIGIIITVIVLLFILSSYLAWKRRKRTRRQCTSTAESIPVGEMATDTSHDSSGLERPTLISSGMRSPTKATVVNTFITDLPDELCVAFGQRLNILAEYDDGWTLCVNEKGEQGMVPIECLAVYRGKE